MDETLNGMTDFGKLFKNHVFQSVCLGMGISSGSVVKNPPANEGDLVRSLGWEDPMKKEMATHSRILVWRIPRDTGAWQAIVHGVAKSWTCLSV